ncbi:hypothetical protein LTR67_010733 [Exophiala xenobiotica]
MATQNPVIPAARIQAEQYLRQHLTTLNLAMAMLAREQKIADRMTGAHAYKYKITKVPEQIISNNQVTQVRDPLSRCPAEVQHLFFQLLPLDADRAALALTCKKHAETYEALKEKKIKKKINEIEVSQYFLPRPKWVTEIHRLQVLVRVQSLIPARFRLCFKCNQYMDINHPDNRIRPWGGLPADRVLPRYGPTKTAMTLGPRCPLCQAAAQLELANHRAEFNEYKRKAKSITMR